MKEFYKLYPRMLSVLAVIVLCCMALHSKAQTVIVVNHTAGDTITLHANVSYPGTVPTFRWTVNGGNVANNTDSVLKYVPLNGDMITCIITPHKQCDMVSDVPIYKIEMLKVPYYLQSGKYNGTGMDPKLTGTFTLGGGGVVTTASYNSEMNGHYSGISSAANPVLSIKWFTDVTYTTPFNILTDNATGLTLYGYDNVADDHNTFVSLMNGTPAIANAYTQSPLFSAILVRGDAAADGKTIPSFQLSNTVNIPNTSLRAAVTLESYYDSAYIQTNGDYRHLTINKSVDITFIDVQFWGKNGPDVSIDSTRGGGISILGTSAIVNLIGENLNTGFANIAECYYRRVTFIATLNGGGIYNEGTLTISKNFKINKCRIYGDGTGVICGGGVYNLGTFNMTGGTISGNLAIAMTQTAFSMPGGGGVWSDKIFNMSGGTICDNVADGLNGGGGGVLINAGKFTMSGPSFIVNNTLNSGNAISGGGGVFLYRDTMNMYGGTISGNISNGYDGGGGVYVCHTATGYGVFNMFGGTISGNQANSVGVTSPLLYGGGGGVKNGGVFKMTGGVIENNIASASNISGNGGGVNNAVYNYNGTTTISNKARITNNTANGTGGGGGIYTSVHTRLFVDSTVVFSGNKANTPTPWMTSNKSYMAINMLYQVQAPFCVYALSGYSNITSISGQTLGTTYDNLYNNYDINLPNVIVTYNANYPAGTYSPNSTFQAYYVNGTDCKILTLDTLATSNPGQFLNPPGYIFLGWATTNTAITPTYAWNGSTFTPAVVNATSARTFYAVWRPTITYHYDILDSQTPVVDTIMPGYKIRGGGIFTPPVGSDIVRWNTASDCNGTYYIFGESYSGAPLELYACISDAFEIWNWDDLSKVMQKQGEGITNFKVMQNIGVPNKPTTFGNGSDQITGSGVTGKFSPYYTATGVDSTRKYGWYGYEGFEGLSGATFTAETQIGTAHGWMQDEGWIPIGNNQSFIGEFDGQGYEINGLWIDRPTDDYQGLFGLIKDAVIKNLGVNIYGCSTCLNHQAVKGESMVGGLAGGVDQSEITNCYTTGEVEGETGSIGGLIGVCEYTTITHCYTTGNVKGDYRVGGLIGCDTQAGDPTSSTNNCYTLGNVTGTGEYIGGLIGECSGTISHCYATGEVSGEDYVGGIAGSSLSSDPVIAYCYALNAKISTSANSTSIGRISPVSFSNCNFNYAYKDMQVINTGGATITPSIGLTNKDGANITACEAIMPLTSTNKIAGLQDAGAWLATPYNSSYKVAVGTNLPILAVFTKDDFPCAIQEPEIEECELDTFFIWNWADLQYLNVLIENQYEIDQNTGNPLQGNGDKLEDYDLFLLMQNLVKPGNEANDADGLGSPKNSNIPCNYLPAERRLGSYGYENYLNSAFSGDYDHTGNQLYVGEGSDFYGWKLERYAWDMAEGNNEGWIPVGPRLYITYPDGFRGHFDGQNFAASELWIDHENSTDPQGLFGSTFGATIENLGVHIDDTVKGEQLVGGFVGYSNFSKFYNCYVTGNVKGGYYVGGFVGQATEGTEFTDCYATGDVICSEENGHRIGGFIGGSQYGHTDEIFDTPVKLTHCYATGNVIGCEGCREVGGFAGRTYDNARVTGCYAIGDVTSGENSVNIGGFIGYIGEDTKITNCYAIGDVTGDEGSVYVGGFAGFLTALTEMTNCYATGNVKGTDQVGGLAGYSLGSTSIEPSLIENCYAFNCKVEATGIGATSIGRIVGESNGYTLTNNYAYDAMELVVGGGTPPTIANNPNDDNGADISMSDATTTTPLSTDMQYLMTGAGAGAWIVTPYSSDYTFAPNTNLPILAAFKNDIPIFVNALQKPIMGDCTTDCTDAPKITLAISDTDTIQRCNNASVTVSGNTFSGPAGIKIDKIYSNGAGVADTVINKQRLTFEMTYTPVFPDDLGKTITVTVTTNNPSGEPCEPDTARLNINFNTVPEFTSLDTMPDICSGETTNYTVAPSSDLTFRWIRTDQTGITPLPDIGSGIGIGSSAAINETLYNTTGAEIDVYYTVAISNSAGCSTAKQVRVTVKPKIPISATIRIKN